MKKQNGITLIALIITIIVMMILVGVTVATALNGGLFNTADEATRKTEKHSIYDQIVGAMKLTNNGNVNVKGTYDEVVKIFGDDKVKATNPTTVDNDTTEVTFTVTGKRGTYEYKITGTEIIVDPTTSEIRYDVAFNDFSAIDWNAMIGQENEVFYGLLFEDEQGNIKAFSVAWYDEPDNYYSCEYYPDLSDTDKYYKCDSDTEYKWIYNECDETTEEWRETEMDAPVISNVKILDAEAVTSLGANAFTESQINQIITKTPVNNSDELKILQTAFVNKVFDDVYVEEDGVEKIVTEGIEMILVGNDPELGENYAIFEYNGKQYMAVLNDETPQKISELYEYNS